MGKKGRDGRKEVGEVGKKGDGQLEGWVKVEWAKWVDWAKRKEGERRRGRGDKRGSGSGKRGDGESDKREVQEG